MCFCRASLLDFALKVFSVRTREAQTEDAYCSVTNAIPGSFQQQLRGQRLKKNDYVHTCCAYQFFQRSGATQATAVLKPRLLNAYFGSAFFPSVHLGFGSFVYCLQLILTLVHGTHFI